MPNSRVDILLHVVWTTYRRLPLIVPEIEQPVYACLMDSARRTRCEVVAIGGMPDHVHVALRLAAETSPSALVRRMKGISSTLVRQRLLPGETFAWQDGYAAFSFSRSHLPKVAAYIRNQKRHHASRELWQDWEPSDNPVRSSPVASR
jgi:putative transposase